MKRILAAAAALVRARPRWRRPTPSRGLWRTAPRRQRQLRLDPGGALRRRALRDARPGLRAGRRPRSPSPNLGRQLIWDTAPSGDGEYRGRVYSPDRDQEYASQAAPVGRQPLGVGLRPAAICREGGVWRASSSRNRARGRALPG